MDKESKALEEALDNARNAQYRLDIPQKKLADEKQVLKNLCLRNRKRSMSECAGRSAKVLTQLMSARYKKVKQPRAKFGRRHNECSRARPQHTRPILWRKESFVKSALAVRRMRWTCVKGWCSRASPSVWAKMMLLLTLFWAL